MAAKKTAAAKAAEKAANVAAAEKAAKAAKVEKAEAKKDQPHVYRLDQGEALP